MFQQSALSTGNNLEWDGDETTTTTTTLFDIFVSFTGIHSPHTAELIEAGCVT